MTMLKTNENGRSMIEMLGVLAIIGVLSVGGIAGYSKAMNKFKTNKVADNVSMIVANVKTLYAQQKNYGTPGDQGTALKTSKAIDLGVIPDELIKTEGEAGSQTKVLRNAYNGTVFVGATKSVAGDTDLRAFYLTFNGLSKEACVALATNDWGSGSSSGLIAMQVKSVSTATDSDEELLTLTSAANMGMGCVGSNTSSTYIVCPGGTTAAVPMKVSEAAKACACGSGNTCSITWKYY